MTHKLIITYVNTMGGDTRIIRTGTFQQCLDALGSYARLDASVGPPIITDVMIRPLRPDEQAAS